MSSPQPSIAVEPPADTAAHPPPDPWRRFSWPLRYAPLALRVSLGLVFIWFGALKIAGDSPVTALIAATVPWVPIGVLMPVLGWVELVLGGSLLLGRPRRLTLIAVAAHLTGTFLTFIDAPQLMVERGNPLLLTGNGEFVLKNLVLITAALVLLAHQPSRRLTAGMR
jgi:putative oxidoreductase